MNEEKDIKNTEVMSEERASTEASVTEKGENQTENAKSAPALPPHKEYARRMLKFQSYYMNLLGCVGAAAALGIVIAVAYNVIIGACLAILCAIIYSVFTYDEMLKGLGIGYKSVEGGIKVTAVRARYGEVIWIPSSLIWFDIVAIGDRAFESDKNSELKKVFLPKTLKSIGSDIFFGCESICEIYFEGTEQEWEQIEKETDLTPYKVIFEAKYPPIPKKKKKSAPKKEA
ncbi:MAG: hypothetical protein IJV72_05570 [Clostridia bacterium]|nr:hypothetical protein [Clostridia bacterium]